MEKKFTKNVQAYIQILPNINECWDDVKILEDNKTIYARSLQDFGKGKVNVVPNYWTFTTNGVLYNLNINDIFDSIIKESLKKAVFGIDTLIFAYGQTGTGKSSTINGLQNNFESRGLAPRILTELFNLKEIYSNESNIKFSISYVEISRSYALDLLKNNNNRILYHPYKNLEKSKIKTESDGLKILFQGESQRSICHNSHISNKLTSVFTVYVRSISRSISNPTAKYSKIHIIDMAGIDTGGNASCQWKKAKDIGTGNLNKTQLEQCLMAIHADVVHRKTSIKDAGVLVDYLGQSLTAQSIIKFIGHIRTTREDLPITLSTLRFANIARRVKSEKTKPLVTESPELVIENLQDELTKLKHQIDLNSMLMNEDLSYNITQSRIQQMESAVEDYIKSKSNDLVLLNITDAKTAVNIFKEICTKLAEDIIEARKQIPCSINMSIKSVSKGSVTSALKTEEKTSKLNKVIRSRESQITAKKRKSTDKSSRYSKLSTQSKSKVHSTGTLTKSGITVGQIMSYDYEGDATKSLKLNSKSISKPTVDRISEEISETSFSNNISIKSTRLSEINLQTELGDDFVEVWNIYKNDETFKYDQLNSTLQYIEQITKGILRDFNDQLNKLQDKVQTIDMKKNDLLKIQIFKEANLQCGSVESIRLNEAQENIAVRVIELINDTIELKEELLNMQSEMKINIDEYHRIKSNIMKDFTDYCIATYKIKLPSTEQIIECIEDKINYPEIKSTDSQESKEYHQKCAFYKYQSDMKKVQQKILEENKLK